MERPRLSPEQRKSSFNPKAATFNPTPNIAMPDPKPARCPSSTLHVIPTNLYDRLIAHQYELLSQPMETNSSTEGDKVGAPASDTDLDDLSSYYLDVKAVAQPGQERTVALNRDIQLNQAPQIDTMSGLMAHSSPFTFQSQAPEPNLDELNTSLGLPGLRTESATIRSPVRSRISRSPPEISAAYGKLIGRALDKALTAEGLARYLNNANNTSSDDTMTGPLSSTNTTTTMNSDLPQYEEEQNLRIVRGATGFSNETSHSTKFQKPRSHYSPMKELKHTPISPVALQSPHSNKSARPGYHGQHYPPVTYGSPLSKKRPRAATRTKRLDQGPEPSAADIYPDDANWELSRSPQTLRRPSIREPFVPRLLPLQEVRGNDSSSWPTPAEVYKQKSPTRIPTSRPNVVDKSMLPNAAVVFDDDLDVVALLDNLPHIPLKLLVHYEMLDAIDGQRPIMLGQQNGSAYGLQHHGLGLGMLRDEWNPKVPEEHLRTLHLKW